LQRGRGTGGATISADFLVLTHEELLMSLPSLSRMFVVVRAALVASAFVILWTWLAASVRPYDARWAFTLPAWPRPLGWALILAGALLALWCIGTFAIRGRGTPAPFDPPREFVAVGPYRYVRNPMYVGAFGILLGAGLVLRSPSVVGLAVLFFLLAHLLVLFYEEPSLDRRFGTPYRRYRAAVRRWLPGPARPPQA
jgi:protein-S-isoprenylcysteine O-methyltransferase Ste14